MRTLLNLGLRLNANAAPARVLVCGDADFAYSCALASRLGDAARVTATAYETEDALLLRYPHAAAAMVRLRSLGAFVRCGIDARTLGEHFSDDGDAGASTSAAPPPPTAAARQWERIVFNLPQAPAAPKARNQIQRHRALLREFCASAATQLATSGEVWVALLSGQGGTPLDPIQRPVGDTWQIMHEAARAGLLVVDVSPADLDALADAGYTPTGRRSGEKARSLGPVRKQKGMMVHVLAAEGGAAEGGAAAGGAAAEEVVGVAPLEWTFDNSFWLEGGDPMGGEEMRGVCRQALGGREAHALGEESCALIDEYEPSDGRRARTYRFVYRSDRIALSRERALGLNAVVCEALGTKCFAPRVPSPQGIAQTLEAQEGQEGGAGGASGAALGDEATARATLTEI